MMAFLEQILRNVSDAARFPVIIALLAFLVFSFYSIGTLVVEARGERRLVSYRLSALLDSLEGAAPEQLQDCVRLSGLPTRHRRLLLNLLSHPEFDREMMESLADNLLEKEQAHYDRILSATTLVARLAPMAGLLGTLIPLGPGIIALSAGDTATLSRSLLTAFDTTTIGLIASAICLVIGHIRSAWYADYMSDLQTLADCVLDCRSRGNGWPGHLPKDVPDGHPFSETPL